MVKEKEKNFRQRFLITKDERRNWYSEIVSFLSADLEFMIMTKVT